MCLSQKQEDLKSTASPKVSRQVKVTVSDLFVRRVLSDDEGVDLVPELRNWNSALIVQRDSDFGCIPAGYEWLLRISGVRGVDFDHFQEEFNLQAQGKANNNFDSIADVIELRYPHIRIRRKGFDRGSEKVQFLQDLIERNIPCLMSLALTPQGNWHIMPVISIDSQKIKLIWVVDLIRGPVIYDIEKTEVVRRHDNWPGGKDIAWVDIG